jgi:ribokinase
LLGKLGKDAFGDSLQQFLQGETLHLDYLSFSDDAPTGVALIVVDENSENTIVVLSGSNFEITDDDVAQVDLQPEDIVVSVFEIPQPTIRTLFKKAQDIGAKTILNPAPANPFVGGLEQLVNYLVLNETELAFFAGTDNVSDDVATIREQAMKLRQFDEQVIIVTLGSKGVVCLAGDDIIRVEGREVDAVDTTGAGDCFVGALAVALSEGQALEQALNFANVAASISVQTLGASASLPHRETVESELNE